MFKRSSEELKLLQRIRDEAHRFAITFHRSLRNKMEYHDPLLDIRGIGKAKMRALYAQYGTLEKMKTARIEELQLVKGIDLDLAKRIYERLNTNSEK